MTDAELLSQFVDSRAQNAFSELVSRHLGWVTASARRRLGDSSLAEDAAQAVFVLLAQKASSLRREVVLSAWLFATLRFVCLAMARDAGRRRRREQEAALMRSEEISGGDSVWDGLVGELDDVVSRLNGTDRRAVLLRYYENKTFVQVGETLGVSEEAARKRVERAVAKLASMFRRRGVNVGAESLGGLLVAHVAVGAVGGNVGAVTGAALAASSASSAVVKSVGSLMFFAQMKTAALVVAVSSVVLAVGGAAVVIAGGAGGSAKPQASIASPAATAPAVAATLPAVSVADVPAKFAAGQIFSPDDKLVVGARVILVGYDVFHGFISLASGSSDANGRFHLAVPANAYPSSVLMDAPPFAYGASRISEDAEDAVVLTAPKTAEVTLQLADGSPAVGVAVSPQQCNGGTWTAMDNWAVEFPEEMKKTLVRKTDAAGKCRFERMPAFTNMTLDMRDARFAALTYTEGVEIHDHPVTIGKPVKLALAGSIAGHVVDLEGKPAAGVLVAAAVTSGGAFETAITDAAGTYRIGRLSAGNFNVIVGSTDEAAPNSLPAEWTAVARQNVAVTSGATVSGIDFQQERGTVIRGKVTLRDTHVPVAGISVNVLGPARPGNVGMLSTLTLADGSYVLRVPAGIQNIYVSGDAPPGYSVSDNSVSVKTVLGKESTQDFKLGRAKGKPLSGVVQYADGSPAAGANVEAEMTGDVYGVADRYWTKADAAGKFSYAALPATSRLRATRGRFEQREPVDVRGGETNVIIVIDKGVAITLSGRVVDAGGNGIAKADVMMEKRIGKYGLELRSTTADAQGRWSIGDLRFGEKYSVQAKAPRFGKIETDVKLVRGEKAQTQNDLVLAKAESVVAGTVVDAAEKPVAGVLVTISGKQTAWQEMTTAANGEFSFADVVDGEKVSVMLRREQEFVPAGEVEAGDLGAVLVFGKKK